MLIDSYPENGYLISKIPNVVAFRTTMKVSNVK